MTKKLETLFDLPTADDAGDDIAGKIPVPENLTPEQTQTAIFNIDNAIDKIDAALPAVQDLATGDNELDELADLAKDKFKDLMDLGMHVDSRFASEIFAVAGTMLGHALTAKTAKINKKLKMVDLQLRKARLDQQNAKESEEANDLPTAEGHVLDRNELLTRLMGDRSQKAKKE